MNPFRSTTIIGVRRNGKVALAGDGQVSFGDTVIKQGAKKIRKIYNNTVLVGFAGTAADSITLYEKFEGKLEEHKGNLKRAIVELAKYWRSDKILRRLEALLVVLSKEHSYIVSGQGEVIEPDDDIVAIGSGGPYALAVARGLAKHSQLSAREIVEESIRIAASICVYTNENLTVVELG